MAQSSESRRPRFLFFRFAMVSPFPDRVLDRMSGGAAYAEPTGELGRLGERTVADEPSADVGRRPAVDESTVRQQRDLTVAIVAGLRRCVARRRLRRADDHDGAGRGRAQCQPVQPLAVRVVRRPDDGHLDAGLSSSASATASPQPANRAAPVGERGTPPQRRSAAVRWRSDPVSAA